MTSSQFVAIQINKWAVNNLDLLWLLFDFSVCFWEQILTRCDREKSHKFWLIMNVGFIGQNMLGMLDTVPPSYLS